MNRMQPETKVLYLKQDKKSKSYIVAKSLKKKQIQARLEGSTSQTQARARAPAPPACPPSASLHKHPQSGGKKQS